MKNLKPKDLKRSLRDKYIRRLQWLAHAVEQYEKAASDRLEHGGNIRDRDKIREILKILVCLKEHLPEKPGLDEEMNRRLCELLDIEYVPFDKNV